MTLANFPSTPLPIRAEAFIDSTWTDITSYVRLDAGIILSGRGKANEQGRASPCTATFTLNDHSYVFNNRLPSSPYYGKLLPNLPIRFSVTEDRSFAIYDELDGCYVKTADKAVLDITSEIDIRIEFELSQSLDGIDGHILAAKRVAGGQSSWMLNIHKTGVLQVVRSTDGSNLLGTNSTVALPDVHGPQAVRVTWDGDDGAGNRVAKFYTSDSNTISGPWTQLGATVTTAGTSSMFASTAPVELGRHNNGANLGIREMTGLRKGNYALKHKRDKK